MKPRCAVRRPSTSVEVTLKEIEYFSSNEQCRSLIGWLRPQDPGSLQTGDDVLRALPRDAERLRNPRSSHERISNQRVGCVGGLSAYPSLPKSFPELITQQKKGLSRAHGTSGLGSDSAQEKLNPCLVLAVFSDRLEPVDVLCSMTLEERRQVQERLLKHAALDEVEDDEQPPQTTVAIKEWVDGLELVMHECAPNEQRQFGVLVQIPLKVVEGRPHQIRLRWNEHGVRRTASTDPVRRATELPRGSFLTAHPAQEFSVHFSKQTIAQREFTQALQSKFEGAHVIEDLTHILALRDLLGFSRQHLSKSRQRPFDASTRHCLPTKRRLNEQMRGKAFAQTCQSTESAIGFGKRYDETCAVVQISGDGCWLKGVERRLPPTDACDSARPLRRELRRIYSKILS